MASRLSSRLASRLLNNATVLHHNRRRTIFTLPYYSPLTSLLNPQPTTPSNFRLISARFLATARRQPSRSKVDIGARARQIQSRRLWTYGLTFSCVAGFIIIVLSQFQDQLVFYVTPTQALAQHTENPTKTKFRLGGLVLEGSVAQPASSPEMEFVVTDLVTDVLIRYQGSLPDLFREGHSVVVEGFIKPITEEIKKQGSENSVSAKARSGDCYFSASEVLAKHDEKYMPQEVAAAIEKNKKIIAEAAAEKDNVAQKETVGSS